MAEYDLISKTALLRHLDMAIDCKDCPRNTDRKTYYERCACSEVADICNTITDFATFADVQPVRHGRWVEQKHTRTNGYNYNVPYSTYICSSCGLEIHNDEYSKYVRGTYTNCPVCTTRMDGDLE